MLIILGFFSITRLEFDLSVLAAILAVIGYSLNDTIVVSDRIRENFRKLRKMTPLQMIDVSLNETLGRTLVTSLTTMLVLTSLAVVGGDMIYRLCDCFVGGCYRGNVFVDLRRVNVASCPRCHQRGCRHSGA